MVMDRDRVGGGSIGLAIGTGLGLMVSKVTLFEKHLPPKKN